MTASITATWFREHDETEQAVENRMIMDTCGAVQAGDANVRWEGNFLIYDMEMRPKQFFETVLQISVGEFFYNDSVVCPTCQRVNEVRP